MNNITLIGMPGVGKSTVGVILAKELGYDFIDSDLIIQKKTGRRLSAIIAREGIDGFLKIENDICSSIQVDKSVIATGGSVVYGKDAMEHLRSISRIVYLRLDVDTLSARLNNLKNRGVVIREGQTFDDLYNERCALYEKYADYIVDESGKDIEATLLEVVKLFNE
ncbi:MAG: shikimate kinase [Pseudobutyrivibrio sp.]|mgnify:CR=1 FL=1|nr:shikimate kinase [Pseudobutyrivibrio sp.]